MASCSRYLDSNSESDHEVADDHHSAEESECEMSPPRSKKVKKLTGAATYRTKFNPEWKREFSFVTSVHGDPYRLANLS